MRGIRVGSIEKNHSIRCRKTSRNGSDLRKYPNLVDNPDSKPSRSLKRLRYRTREPARGLIEANDYCSIPVVL